MPSRSSVRLYVLLFAALAVTCSAADRVLFLRIAPTEAALYISNADGSAERPLTQPGALDYNPAWSPKGDWIAFIRRIHGDFEIFTLRPGGKDLKQLTTTHGNEAHLAWSPDGEQLLFTSSRMGFKDEALYTGAPQPYGEIFVMRFDGTHVEQLTDNQWEDGGPAWQPHRPDSPVATAHEEMNHPQSAASALTP